MICVASASAAPLARDAKCFVISNTFAQRGDNEQAKEVAKLSSYFYLGRLAGTPQQIEAALVAQAKALTPQTSGAVMQECAKTMAQSSSVVEAIGKKLGNKPVK